MRFAPSLRQTKDATTRSAYSTSSRRIGFTDWDVDKAVAEGMERVTWVFKAVHTIAANQARLPMVVREEDRWKGQIIEDHPLLPLYNRKANDFEKIVGWRYRLSCLLLLSRQGVFVEVLRSRIGEPLGLFILPPGLTNPVKDPDTFVSGFEVNVPGQGKRRIDPENVLWFRLPHPTDPYRSLTPLDACGLAVEADWWARVYNRNFMLNDGRPGGVLVVKGELDDDDAEIIRNRFAGPPGMTGAGRTTVIGSEGGADWVDTAITPREAQYLESRKVAREEIEIAFGVPETVMGLAANRTFANAEAETETFWRETMLFHLELVAQPFDELDGDEEQFAGFDISGVEVLQRDRRAREQYHLEELKHHAITPDEYREITGREPMGGGAAQLYRPINLVPVTGERPVKVLDLPEPRLITVASRALPAATVRALPVRPGQLSINVIGEDNPDAVGPQVVEAVRRELDKADTSTEDTNVDFGEWKVSARRLAARRRERLAKMGSWERTAKASMNRLFARQRSVTVEKLKGAKSRQSYFEERDGDLFPTKAVDAGTIFDREKWNAQLADDSRAWIEGTMEDFGGDVADTLNGTSKQVKADETDPDAVVVTFDIEDPAIQELIEDQVNRLTLVNDTTYDAIKATLAEGVGEGESITKLAKRIEAVFSEASRVRSEMIARTEVLGASNAAAVQAAKGAGIEGLRKTWLSTSDKRTRDDHRDANGQTVDLDEKFTVGGSAMDHPGDPAAPAEQTIRCRCTTVMATADDVLL